MTRLVFNAKYMVKQRPYRRDEAKTNQDKNNKHVHKVSKLKKINSKYLKLTTKSLDR